MRRLTIGPDLTCGVIGLGCNNFTDLENREAVEVAHRAIDLGVNHFDCADIYGDGCSEAFLGQALGSRRDEIVLVSKFGIRRTAGGNVFDGTPQYARLACEASLHRLGASEIDLYYQHAIDPAVPVEDTAGAMADLARVGKIRAIGLCNCTAELIRRAHAVHPTAAVQMEYSLMDRAVEEDVLPTCKELGIAFVAYGPLTYAFLAGGVKRHADLPEGDMFRRRQSRFEDANIAQNLGLLASLDEIAAELRATPAQVALAWCLHRPFDVLPIPGSTRMRHLEENAVAANIALSAEQVRKLDSVFASGAPRGGRMPG